MTAHGTTDIAIEATRHGAFDYLLKPFEMPAMLHAIERALAATRLMSQPVEIGNVVAGRDAIIGTAAPCRRSIRRSDASRQPR